MTAIADRVQCPVEGCGYTMGSEGSVPAHVAMAHPETPIATVAPKRSSRKGDAATDPDACVRDASGCATHNAIWIQADERCHARGGRVSPFHALPTTDPTLSSPRDGGSASAGETARDAASSGQGVLAPAIAPSAPAIAELPLDLVDVGHNVRINVAELEELAASIAEHGVLQPIKATGPHADGRYLVTWGQRRTLASQIAGRTTIPAIVLPPTADVDADGAARSIEQLVENLHRADLNPIDRAQAMRAVVDSGVSQAELARKLGIAPSTVANDLRLLEAAPKVRDLLSAGEITPAHVKAILGLDEAEQVRLAERAKGGTSAHQLESDARYYRQLEADRKKKTKANAAAIKHAIEALADVPKDAPIVVHVPWDMDGAGIRAAVQEAGWTNLVEGWGEKPDGCGCTTRRLEINGGKGAQLTFICADREHSAARAAKRREEQLAREEADRVEREILRGALTDALATVSPTLLRLIHRSLENYNGKTWAQYGKESNADVAREIAQRMTNGYGQKPIPTEKVVEALRAEAAAG